MATGFYQSQYFTTTLSVVGGIDDTATTTLVFQDVSGIADTSKPGIALINYADPLDTSVAEWITFTSINSTTKTPQGVVRGAEGFSAKSHSNGVTVAFPVSKSHVNPLVDAVSIGGSATNILQGVLDEDDMASDSAVKVATQQSIKAYIDSNSGVTPTPQTCSPSNTSSTPNTTWADVTNGSITVSCAVGDKLLIVGHMTASKANAGGRIDGRIVLDSTTSVAIGIEQLGASALASMAFTGYFVATGTSHTFKLQYSDQLAAAGAISVVGAPHTGMQIVNLKQ